MNRDTSTAVQRPKVLDEIPLLPVSATSAASQPKTSPLKAVVRDADGQTSLSLQAPRGVRDCPED